MRTFFSRLVGFFRASFFSWRGSVVTSKIKKVMASIGKTLAIRKVYFDNDVSDDDDDDSDLVVDEDTPPPADDAPPQLQEVNKKKRKRVSETVKRYTNDLHALLANARANPEDEVALVMEFKEEYPPTKKRRTEENENKKPKKYNGYQMFCKNKQDDVKNIPHTQRMTELGRMWSETAEKTHWKTLADEENKRIDPTYEVKVPQEKKSVNPMLDWIMDRLSKMPQYAGMTKKVLRKIGENEIKEDGPMVAEFKCN